MSDTRHTRHAENVYLNITVNNDNTDGTKKLAQYNAEYENPIIENPSDYYLSVVKFQIPLDELPLFIIPVVPGQTLTLGSGVPINTPFIVGMYPIENPVNVIPPIPKPPIGAGFGRVVTWVPQFWNLSPPLTTGTTVDLDNIKFHPLMYAYSYQSVLDRINIALLGAWQDAGFPGAATSDYAPYFLLKDNKFQLVISIACVAAGWAPYVNINLLEVFQGFNYNVSADGQRFQFDTVSWPKTGTTHTNANLYAQPPIGVISGAGNIPEDLIIPQEYSNFEYLTSVRKIIMTSNTIPARKEYYPVPGSSGANTTGVNNGLGIISDFQLVLNNNPGEQRSIATYNSDLYRMVDLVSTHPLRKIDVNFFWADEFDNLFPLFISPYGNINVKLGFFHKNAINTVQDVNDNKVVLANRPAHQQGYSRVN